MTLNKTNMAYFYLKFPIKILNNLSHQPTKSEFEIAILKYLAILSEYNLPPYSKFIDKLPTDSDRLNYRYFDSFLELKPSSSSSEQMTINNKMEGYVILKFELPSQLEHLIGADGFIDDIAVVHERTTLFNPINLRECYYASTQSFFLSYSEPFSPTSLRLSQLPTVNRDLSQMTAVSLLFCFTFLYKYLSRAQNDINSEDNPKDVILTLFLFVLFSSFIYMLNQKYKFSSDINYDQMLQSTLLPLENSDNIHALLSNAITEKNKGWVLYFLKNAVPLPENLTADDKTFLDSTLKELKRIPNFQFQNLAPYLYNKFFKIIPYTIYLKNKPREQPETLANPEIPYNKIKVVSNNEGYFTDFDYSARIDLIKGAPLRLNGTPIGYNVALPVSEIKTIIIEVYGGIKKVHREKEAYFPSANQDIVKNWLPETANITLNLPDLLELEVYQQKLPEDLHKKIQECIHHFYTILKTDPESLHPNLNVLRNKPCFLYGSSFGGLIIINHAALYPDTFDGYISNAGALVPHLTFDNPLDDMDKFMEAHLDPSLESKIVKINKPILLLQNMDDNCVRAEVVFEFYNLFRSINKHHLLEMFINQIGIPDEKNVFKKGHGFPANLNDKRFFFQAISRFMEMKPFIKPLSELRYHIGSRQAKVFSTSASLTEVFVGEAMQIAKEQNHTIENIHKFMHPCQDWIPPYKNIYNALYYSRKVTKDEKMFAWEIKRLSSILTDAQIKEVLKSQSAIFFDFINEVSTHNAIASDEMNKTIFAENTKLVASFRKKLQRLEANSPSAVYWLSQLYKANPELLYKPAQTFTKDLNFLRKVNKGRGEFINFLAKKQSLTFSIWHQAQRMVVEKARNEPENKLGPLCSY